MSITAILLAGGKGKRMHSRIPKVLNKIDGQPLLFYSLNLLGQLPINDIQVVVGYQKDMVKSAVLEIKRKLKIRQAIGFAVQKKALGTGDAVGTALKHIKNDAAHILVLNGDDSFLYKPETIKEVLNLHQKTKSDLTFITLKVKNPTGKGRIMRDSGGKVVKIVEEKAATGAQKEIREINDGCYVFEAKWVCKFIEQIGISAVGPPRLASSSGEAGEYYLTDLVEIGAGNGAKIETYKLEDASEWFGVNTKEQLAQANQIVSSAHKI